MKFFIYLCCIAHLITVISARLRLTTPMPSEHDDAASQTSKIAEIIDFVNSIYDNNGRSIAQGRRYDRILRRFILPAVKGINLPPSVVVPNDEDTQNQLENLADTVRYQVIDNPEVLEEYSNKQKQKNNEKPLKPLKSISVDSDTSTEAKSFSTSDKKLRYYHSKSNSTASHTSTNNNKFDEFLHTPNPNPLDIVQELTTVKSTTYQPSFPDGDDDDDIQMSVTEEEISTPRANANNHDDLKINNTLEIEKRTLGNKASGKEDQAGIKEEKAPTDDTKETVQMKNELPIKNNNDEVTVGVTVGVTVNGEKSGSNKEYMSSKLDYNTSERPSEDNVRTRDEYNKNDGNKNTYVTTDTTSEKDNKPKVRSLGKSKVSIVPVERLMGRIFKSALRNKPQKNNYDSKEHSIYAHKERSENNNKQFENRHVTRDEYDRKKKDKKKYNRWSKTENNWNKIDKQRYKKDSGYDRMEYEWNKRHQQYDEKDNWNKNGNQWDKNDEFGSRDRDLNKRDNDWDKRDNDWKKRDFDSNKRDNDWNERDIDSNKRVNDWNNRDIDSNKRDNDWNKRDNDWNNRDNDSNKRVHDWNNREIDSNKRDNDWNKRDNEWNKRDNDWNNRDIDSNKRDNNWNKRDTEWIKQDSKTYKVDRNKNDMDPKQNEWDNKYLQHTTVVIDGGIAKERYEIIERNIKDGDKRHFEI